MTNIFTKECKFALGVQKADQLPNDSIPQVAFIGRSNVGKSSLVNSILSRAKLARTSQNPGCTQQLNFFNLSDILYLVDLPGYGFAKVSKQQRDAFNKLVRYYLRTSVALKRIFLLLDSRHDIKETDRAMMDFLDDHAVSYQLVLTKSDDSKLIVNNLSKLNKLIDKHPACYPEVLITSSVTKVGVDILRDSIPTLILL